MLKNGPIDVGSNGSGTPGNNTRNTRKPASRIARSNATWTSGRCHAPMSPAPSNTAHDADSRRPAANPSCQSAPGTNIHTSSHGRSRRARNCSANRSTAALSTL